MAKLLQTNLPFATGPNVTAETFNQLVRTLEINLGSVDPDNTLQLTTAERDELNFNIGQIIYNTTTTTLQYWDGTNFQNISALGAVNLNVSDGSATIGINLNTQTLSLIGGTGITSNASGTSVTFAIDNTVVTLTGTQTLTNKTLTSPTLTSPVLNGTLSGSAFKDEDNMASNSATAVASQQSIKAYVDSQVGTVDTLAEILANGNTTGGTNISVSTGDSITFDDGSLVSNGTAFRIDGAAGKEVEILSARDIRFVVDDNNDDTNNTFQVFRHNTGSSNMLFEIEQDGDTNLKLGDLQIAGITVIDSSRNLTNIGTISSGAITTTGLVNADSLEVQNDSTFNGNLDATGQEVAAATFVINNIAINGSSSATTSATTQVAVDTVSKTVFRTVKYLVQITNSTDTTFHATEILVTHDGTTPSMTEYATIFTGAAEEATFSADISGSNLRLLATPASTDSMTFKITRTGIKV